MAQDLLPSQISAGLAIGPKYAGFWRRFAAYIVDAIIVSLLDMVLLLPFIGLIGTSIFLDNIYNPSAEFLLAVLTMLAGTVFLTMISGWLYFAILETMKQATPGKRLVGIKVTDLHGRRITFGRASGRYFAKILSSLTFGVGYIMAGMTRQKQGLHDMLAGCLVVDRSAGVAIQQPEPQAPH